jgi:hypothetical protein
LCHQDRHVPPSIGCGSIAPKQNPRLKNTSLFCDAILYQKRYHFTKTGSGQKTIGKVETKARLFSCSGANATDPKNFPRDWNDGHGTAWFFFPCAAPGSEAEGKDGLAKCDAAEHCGATSAPFLGAVSM